MRKGLFTISLVAACTSNPAVESPGHEPPAVAEAGQAAAGPPSSGSLLAIAAGGFSEVEREEDDAHGRLRYSSPPGSACMVDVDWWRPRPPTPGGPMAPASSRPVTVDGRATEVVTTSTFQGVAREVDAVFLSGDAYQIRIVFDACGPTEEDAFLAGVRITGG